MRLRRGMISDYLMYVTSLEFVNPGDMTEDMSIYDEAIDAMARNAQYDGNLESLRLAIDSLLAGPEGRLEKFYGSGYPFSDRELLSILRYVYQTIWPDAYMSEPGEAVPVEFVEMTKADWDAAQTV